MALATIYCSFKIRVLTKSVAFLEVQLHINIYKGKFTCKVAKSENIKWGIWQRFQVHGPLQVDSIALPKGLKCTHITDNYRYLLTKYKFAYYKVDVQKASIFHHITGNMEPGIMNILVNH